MITAKLIDGISHKQCIQCNYSTIDVDKMLKHLNDHRLDEIEVLKASNVPDKRYKVYLAGD